MHHGHLRRCYRFPDMDTYSIVTYENMRISKGRMGGGKGASETNLAQSEDRCAAFALDISSFQIKKHWLLSI